MQSARLLSSDGSWSNLEKQWQAQCENYEMVFEQYASGTINALRDFATSENKNEWAYGIAHDGEFVAVALMRLVCQKPFSGLVLRVREFTVSPALDWGDVDDTIYGEALKSLFLAAINVSESELRAQHIKMHLPSPYDAKFYSEIAHTLDSKVIFEAVDTHGSWLIMSKKNPLSIVRSSENEQS